jgi:hypothetical protein
MWMHDPQMCVCRLCMYVCMYVPTGAPGSESMLHGSIAFWSADLLSFTLITHPSSVTVQLQDWTTDCSSQLSKLNIWTHIMCNPLTYFDGCGPCYTTHRLPAWSVSGWMWTCTLLARMLTWKFFFYFFFLWFILISILGTQNNTCAIGFICNLLCWFSVVERNVQN